MYTTPVAVQWRRDGQMSCEVTTALFTDGMWQANKGDDHWTSALGNQRRWFAFTQAGECKVVLGFMGEMVNVILDKLSYEYIVNTLDLWDSLQRIPCNGFHTSFST